MARMKEFMVKKISKYVCHTCPKCKCRRISDHGIEFWKCGGCGSENFSSCVTVKFDTIVKLCNKAKGSK